MMEVLIFFLLFLSFLIHGLSLWATLQYRQIERQFLAKRFDSVQEALENFGCDIDWRDS